MEQCSYACTWIQLKVKFIHESWVWMQGSNDTRRVCCLYVCSVCVCVWGGGRVWVTGVKLCCDQLAAVLLLSCCVNHTCVCSYLVKLLRQFFSWLIAWKRSPHLTFVHFLSCELFRFNPKCVWRLYISHTHSFCCLQLLCSVSSETPWVGFHQVLHLSPTALMTALRTWWWSASWKYNQISSKQWRSMSNLVLCECVCVSSVWSAVKAQNLSAGCIRLLSSLMEEWSCSTSSAQPELQKNLFSFKSWFHW